MRIEVYTDGSAMTKGLPGGWGSVICVDGQKVKELSGYLESATNNDAELIAAIRGLEFALELSISRGDFDFELDVTLCSDSQLVLGWASGEYRFKQLDKMALYDTLSKLVRKMKVKTRWVAGHSGDEHNERCDKLANLARKQIAENPETAIVKSLTESKIGKKKDGIVCLWYGENLKVIDLINGVIENFNRDVHGKRGSVIQIREEKFR